MPKVDFSKLKMEIRDFMPIPPDTYFCSLAEVEEASADNGGEIWKLKFLILAGPYQGRYLFERVEFIDDELSRLQWLCFCLGIDASGEVELTPAMIKGRVCYVSVGIEEYDDFEGDIKQRSVVLGYKAFHKSIAGLVLAGDRDGNLPLHLLEP